MRKKVKIVITFDVETNIPADIDNFPKYITGLIRKGEPIDIGRDWGGLHYQIVGIESLKGFIDKQLYGD